VHARLVVVRADALGERLVHLPELAGELVVGQVRQVLRLHQAVGDVDPEPVDATVQPEAQHAVELCRDLGVGPVEVRLATLEQVQVPLPVRQPGPRRTAELRDPVVGWTTAVGPGAVAEDVARPLGASRRRCERCLEPRVLVRRVVRHDVDDQPHAEVVGARAQGVEVVQRAEQRVDVAVVGHVVAMIGLR
jgi:hypothetical protein